MQFVLIFMGKRPSMRYFFPALLLLITCYACNSGGNAPVDAAAPIDSLATDTGISFDPAIAPHLQVFDSIYGSAPLYFKEAGQFYFYVVNAPYDAYSIDGGFGNFKIGIVTEKLDTILPIAYDKLYTPDVTAKGYIETQVDGKHGLVNYRTKQIIQPRYEVIFPSQQPNTIAIGRLGNQYYLIKTDGQEELITDENLIPRYMLLQSLLAVSTTDTTIPMLMDSYAPYYDSKDYTGFAAGRGIIIPPSYMLPTGFVKEYIIGVNTGEEGTDFDLITHSEVVEGTTNPWGIDILIATFYEEAVEARGEIVKEKHIATIDSKNNVVSKANFPDGPYSYYGLCPDSSKAYRFLTDTLLEVKSYVYNYMNQLPAYDYMPIYSYYSISPQGQIKQLDSDRFFDFTKYIIISDEYFKGCYAVDSVPFSPIEDDTLKTFITSYLSEHMLDVMRNEIYAEYGLKFKEKEWDAYFREEDWYKPRYGNVDDKLTEIDKANLETIQKAKEQLQKDPDKLLNERFEVYQPAG